MSEANLKLITAELAHAGEDPELRRRLEQLELRRITPDKALPPMDFLFNMFGKPCFPRGELASITGKPKSGKTFISSILIAVCLGRDQLSILKTSPQTLRVLWFDTEQSDESTQDILKNRVIPMVREASPQPSPKGEGEGEDDLCKDFLHVFNVRQESWRDRLPLLETAIEHFKPDFVLLDGIRDLVNDINDGIMAQDVVERLMRIASDGRCCIACIIHQNKALEDKNSRGAIGSELTNKSFESYESENLGQGVFAFSQTKTRKHVIPQTLRYIVGDNGIPMPYFAMEDTIGTTEKAPEENSKNNYNKEYITEWQGKTPIFDVGRLFTNALPDEWERYPAKEVRDKVMQMANIKSIFIYDEQLSKALAMSIISKTTDELGHVVYYRKSSEGVLPF